jgi:hypothetical protein
MGVKGKPCALQRLLDEIGSEALEDPMRRRRAGGGVAGGGTFSGHSLSCGKECHAEKEKQ